MCCVWIFWISAAPVCQVVLACFVNLSQKAGAKKVTNNRAYLPNIDTAANMKFVLKPILFWKSLWFVFIQICNMIHWTIDCGEKKTLAEKSIQEEEDSQKSLKEAFAGWTEVGIEPVNAIFSRTSLEKFLVKNTRKIIIIFS